MKVCQIKGCNEECLKGRRYCHKHFLEHKREQYKQGIQDGTLHRTTYPKICIVCGKQYNACRKTSLYCSKACSGQAHKNMSSNATNHYEYDSENYKQSTVRHRNIAIQILGRKLNTNEVVHHLDLDPKNNNLENLIVLSRSKHAQLHAYLAKQGAICKQLHNPNDENCWKTFIAQTTTAWLETTNAKVKKLSEIRQSAAEPLLNEEGSETMHVASQADDEIVQTATQNVASES